MQSIWFKSSLSSGGDNCVEVKFEGDNVLVRNSKLPHAGTATFNSSEWEAFLGGVRKGEFDLA